jgi:hypothetical protein
MNSSNNTLPTFRDGEKYLECLFDDGHDYTTIDESPRQISATLLEYSVMCICCGDKSFVYSIIEGDMDFEY